VLGPARAQGTPPGMLAFGQQQQGLRLPLAGAAHQFGIGGIHLFQNLYRQGRQEGHTGLPNVFCGPDHGA